MSIDDRRTLSALVGNCKDSRKNSVVLLKRPIGIAKLGEYICCIYQQMCARPRDEVQSILSKLGQSVLSHIGPVDGGAPSRFTTLLGAPNG